MMARQMICGAAFPPDALHTISQAFDKAWIQIAPELGTKISSIEMAQLSLADIVLALAKDGPIVENELRDKALRSFRLRHRLYEGRS